MKNSPSDDQDIYGEIADRFLRDLPDYVSGATRERIIAVTKDIFKTPRSARSMLRVVTKHAEDMQKDKRLIRLAIERANSSL